MENYEFKYLDESTLEAFFFLDFSSHNFHARIKINGFFIESSPTNVKLSITIFMEEIKPVVKEEHEFENRVKPILKPIFGVFAPPPF